MKIKHLECRTESQIFISNRKVIVHMRTYFFQYTPLPPQRTLYETQILMYFFPISKKSPPPPPTSLPKTRSYGTEI